LISQVNGWSGLEVPNFNKQMQLAVVLQQVEDPPDWPKTVMYGYVQPCKNAKVSGNWISECKNKESKTIDLPFTNAKKSSKTTICLPKRLPGS
jgi:hypothetical protein